MQQQQPTMQQQSAPPTFPANDFSLEFLENLPADGANFSAQDLLNSLDHEHFNIQDIL